jgi:LuxR family maltose regulon positive regulatory protein
MTKTTPKVQHNQLYLPHTTQPHCPMDSAAWFAWLAEATSFRYYSTSSLPVTARVSRPMQPISVRKEKRHRGFLWYAYWRVHGQLNKRYVGRTNTLTITRLDQVAGELNTVW